MKEMTASCTYKKFLACKPTEFAGSEGATAVLRWLEKTEVVLKISKCVEEDKVMYASNLFKEEALEWWNTILQAKGSNMAYVMSWEEFKEMTERKCCPPYEKEQMANQFLNHRMVDVKCREYTSKFFKYTRIVLTLASPEPSRLLDLGLSKDAVELANTLTDGLVHTRDENRKKELAQKITQGFRSSNNFKKGVGQSSAPPLCKLCKRRHPGRCNRYCNFCKIPRHREEECRKKSTICYNCGEAWHFKPNYPKLTKAPDNKAKAADGANKKNACAF
ncbi:uncharacterized protein LOC110875528 [Helianthus annuus]|uniref:uncharacterized protein LOC110875528 n=1 Tax=Helianthus annuus TaxID=4232 RepID=UPI000B8F61D2|nr:uncharacterized protein LOC110875528 [Helianthus annuus]